MGEFAQLIICAYYFLFTTMFYYKYLIFAKPMNHYRE